KDLQGRYVFANEAALKAFGTPRVFGKTDEVLFPAELAAQFRENDRRALESETGVRPIEILEHPDGTLHYSLVSKFPIPGPEGRVALVGGMAIDITERRQAELSLRDGEERLRLALKAGRMGVWDWNLTTGEIRWSENLEPIHGL